MPQKAKTPRSHKRLWISAITGLVLLAGVVGLAAYLRSASFEDWVRRKVVAALTDATGGRVEIASFHWNLSQLAFEADDLTIHGLEPPGQLPYAHVDRAMVRLHLISFLERQFSIKRLELQRPVIHLIVNPDGSTNAPQPKVKNASGKSGIQELFDLAIARADLRDGMLVINQRKLPLDFFADDIVAQMSYTPFDRTSSYKGSIQIGKIDLKYQDLREIPASADLQFTLWNNAFQVQSLKLTSQDSSLQASGKLTNFSQPEVRLTYDANLDVAQLGAVARAPNLQGGVLQLNGTADYAPAAGYSTQGHIAFRNLDYLDPQVALRRANLDANFTFGQNRLALSRIAAHVLGGLVTGDADVRNVLSPAPAQPTIGPVPAASKRATARPVVKPRTDASEQQGSARLRAAGLSLNELMRTVSSRSLPLDKLNAVGSVTGTVNLSWKQSLANAVADLALDIAAPAQPVASQLPVNGSLRGRAALRAERIELAALNLNTPKTHLDATGSLGSTSAMLKLKAETTSLSEFQPLISPNAALPIELGGKASFDGTLSGQLRTPQIAGEVQATDVTYRYTPVSNAAQAQPSASPAKHKWFAQTSAPQAPPQPQPAESRRIHIDSFAGDVQYSQTALALHHAVIQEAGAQLHIDGTATLDKGNFTESS